VDRAVDCALALVHQLGVWSLGLPTPAHIRPENALRNRVGSGGSCGICGRAVRRAQTKKKTDQIRSTAWVAGHPACLDEPKYPIPLYPIIIWITIWLWLT
jgi:hypothetical protein